MSQANSPLVALKIAGVFRLKKEETIAERIAQLSEDSGIPAYDLHAAFETERNAREAARIAKIHADANKPVAAGGIVEWKRTDHNGPVIVTACQNNTRINAAFFHNLEAYAKHIGAQLIVAPMLYNKGAFAQPTSVADTGVWFDPLVTPYLQADRIVANGVHVLCNAHVIPTAKNPTSGFEAATPSGVSVVVPASVISMRVMPRLKGERAKVLYSTGAVSHCNYIQRKAGTVAELSHAFGAVIIAADGRMRAVEAMHESGAFYDYHEGITYCCHAGEVSTENGVHAVTLGDIHAEKCSAKREGAIYSFLESVKPMHVFVHDVCDFSSRNHHNRESSLFLFKQSKAGATVESDITRVYDIIDGLASLAHAVHIIDSNHDRALERWLDEAEYRDDPENAITFLRLQLLRYEHAASGSQEAWNPLEAYGRENDLIPRNVTFWVADSAVSDGETRIEYGHHGDRGPNGARGSIQSFRAIGVPMVIGHSHSPGIAGGVYQVGVSGDMDMGYNVGPSSWAHAHCITFDNGQRQMYFEAE